ncbi:chymotrypsin-elastase inhibitor ixodidin-like [Cotesia glomerata]|uniref:TIL domain-containing protein n=1 Tax=Cotesia glomerata TaxID=32391 RepID=A0AAV7JAH2_COTGL|nr:chymotrypsin-elastase inhibitor ixodidin-like [Cotesia glomerata]KAH0568764.1 hypothetical protein KQX54_021455 [Cotesia glomerata]
MSRVILISISLIVSFVVCTHAQDFPCPGENEEFHGCGACDSTCKSDIACTMECRSGSCGCKFGYVRNDQNKCVHRNECHSSISRLGK